MWRRFLRAQKDKLVWPWDDSNFWAAQGDRAQLGYIYTKLYEAGYNVNRLKKVKPSDVVIENTTNVLMPVFKHGISSKQHLILTIASGDICLLEDVLMYTGVVFALTFGKSALSVTSEDFVQYLQRFDRDDQDPHGLMEHVKHSRMLIWADALGASRDRLHRFGSAVSSIMRERRQWLGVTIFGAFLPRFDSHRAAKAIEAAAFTALPPAVAGYLVSGTKIVLKEG